MRSSGHDDDTPRTDDSSRAEGPYRADADAWTALYRAPLSHSAWRVLGILVGLVILTVLAPLSALGLYSVIVMGMRVADPMDPLAIGVAVLVVAIGSGTAWLWLAFVVRWTLDLALSPRVFEGTIDKLSLGRRPFLVVGEDRLHLPRELASRLTRGERVRLSLTRATRQLVRLEQSTRSSA